MGIRICQASKQSAALVHGRRVPGSEGVPRNKPAYQSEGGRHRFRQAAGTVEEGGTSSSDDDERTAFLEQWLDNEDRRNQLALAVDAAFILQGINSVKSIIASKLAHQDDPKGIARFIDEAFEKLQQMEKGLTTAMEARRAGQLVQEELLKEFVVNTKELAARVNKLLTKSSKESEAPEDLLAGLAQFSSRKTAGDAGLAVVERLTMQKASVEGRIMCADYVDALIEQCLKVVQSLVAGLKNVKALFVRRTRTRTRTSHWGLWSPAPQGASLAPKVKAVELPYAIQKVFFATDRIPEKKAGPEGVPAYSNQIQESLETGWTNVSIPSKWEDGSRRERGQMDKDQDDTSERAAQYHIILLPKQNWTYPPNRVAFHEDIRKEAGTSGLLLFIHGYNVSFRSAIRGAAQLAFDLKKDPGSHSTGYGGAVLAYDWASYAETLRYGFRSGNNDRERACASAKRLAVLLQELAVSFRSGRELHIVAHSMGNLCLKQALDLLRADNDQIARFRALTRTATFAAPDVSREEFHQMVNLIVPEKGVSGAPLVTLFCSGGDLALLASSILHFFGSDSGYRAGLYRAWLVVMEGHRVHPVLIPGQVDTVDASGFATDSFGHGYFSNNGSLLTELSKIINLSKSARERLHSQPESLVKHDASCTTCANWYRVVKMQRGSPDG